MSRAGRFRHRTATLTGGPFDGGTARIYPDVGRTGAEPASIHLCLGTNWPHWQPLGWAIYTRQEDGGYTWTATVDQDTPVKPPSVAADGLEPSGEGGDTRETAAAALRGAIAAGIPPDRIRLHEHPCTHAEHPDNPCTCWERDTQPAWGHVDLTAVEAAGRQIAATSYSVADVEANLTRWRKQP